MIIQTQRNLWKLEMIEKRGGTLEHLPKCDLCHKSFQGYQMHELIARSKTINNKEARELSFQPQLCSLLDGWCHEVADMDDISKRLWAFNIKLWGRSEVEAALARLQDVMKSKVYINE